MARVVARAIVALSVAFGLSACSEGVSTGGSGTSAGTFADTGTGDTGTATGAETGDTDGDCIGSALELGDPECDPPPGQTDECIDDQTAIMSVVGPEVTEPLPDSQEAEIAALITADGTHYVATQVLDWESRGVVPIRRSASFRRA